MSDKHVSSESEVEASAHGALQAHQSALLAGMARGTPPVQQRSISGAVQIDAKKRQATFVGSDETADRYGDILRVKGWRLKNYQANPVFLWNHDMADLPIGKAVKVWKSVVEGRPVLKATLEYLDESLSPFADTVFRFVQAAVLRSVSVSFFPLKFNNPGDKDRENLGLGPWGVEYLEQDLLEISQVGVPANPSALLLGAEPLARAYKGAELRREDAEIFLAHAGCVGESCVPAFKSAGMLRSVYALQPVEEVEAPEDKEMNVEALCKVLETATNRIIEAVKGEAAAGTPAAEAEQNSTPTVDAERSARLAQILERQLEIRNSLKGE